MMRTPAIPVTATLEDEPLPPRRRRAMALIAVVALAVAALVVSRAWWERSERRRLDAERAAWRAVGVSPWEPAAVDPAATAAVKAWSDVELSLWWPNGNDPGLDQSVWYPNQNGDLLLEAGWSAPGLAAVRRWVGNNAEPLRRAVRLAATQPAFHGIAVAPVRGPDYREPISLAQVTDLAARLSLFEGNDLGVLQYVDVMSQAAAAAETVPGGSGWTPGIELRQLAAQRVLASFDELQLPRDSEARRLAERWIARCLGRDPVALLRDLIGGESRRWLVEAEPPSDWREAQADGGGNLPAGFPAWQRPVWWWLRPLWMRQLNEALAVSRPAVSAMAQGYRPFRAYIAATAAGVRPPKVTHAEPTDWIIRSTAHGDVTQWLGVGETLRYNVLLDRLAATCLACRLYAIDHDGRDPPRLADLVPTYLPRMPIDPFDPSGKPLGYATVSGVPLVYSVNDVGRDLIAAGTFKPAPGEHVMIRPNRMIVARLHPTTQPMRGTVQR